MKQARKVETQRQH